MIAEAMADEAPRMLGDMIRLIRQEKHLTLSEVSALSGISLSYLSDIEVNRTLPSLPTLDLIAKALDHTLYVELSEAHDTRIPASPAEIELLIALRHQDYPRFMVLATELIQGESKR